MFRFAGPAVALLTGLGCGYVGEPLPPLLNIPERVTDLAAVQRGDKIIIQFSVPKLSTEGSAIKKLGAIELRAGVANPGPFDAEAWAAGTSRQDRRPRRRRCETRAPDRNVIVNPPRAPWQVYYAPARGGGFLRW